MSSISVGGRGPLNLCRPIEMPSVFGRGGGGGGGGVLSPQRTNQKREEKSISLPHSNQLQKFLPLLSLSLSGLKGDRIFHRLSKGPSSPFPLPPVIYIVCVMKQNLLCPFIDAHGFRSFLKGRGGPGGGGSRRVNTLFFLSDDGRGSCGRPDRTFQDYGTQFHNLLRCHPFLFKVGPYLVHACKCKSWLFHRTANCPVGKEQVEGKEKSRIREKDAGKKLYLRGGSPP